MNCLGNCKNSNILSGKNITIQETPLGDIIVNAQNETEIIGGQGIFVEKISDEPKVYKILLDKWNTVSIDSYDEEHGYLIDKIISGEGIVVSKSEDGNKIVLSLSDEVIEKKDFRIKVIPNGEPLYLSEAIKIESDLLDKEISEGKLIIKDKENIPCAKITLNNDILLKQKTGGKGIGKQITYRIGNTFFEGFPNSKNITNANFNIDILQGLSANNNGQIEIKEDGIYDFSFNGNCEICRGGHAVRFILNCLRDGKEIVLGEVRYSAPSSFSESNEGYPKPTNYLTHSGGESGMNFSLGKNIARLPFNFNSIAKLYSGDLIYISVKFSSVMSEKTYNLQENPDTEIAILGNTSSGSNVSGSINGLGATISLFKTSKL